MLVVIGQQVKLHPCLLEEGVPGEAGVHVVVSLIQPVRHLTGLPEDLEDIGKKEHVCPAVEVAVVANGPAPERIPCLLRMGVVIIADVRVIELAVEELPGRECGLGEAFP